jgi:TonB family protein
MEYSLIGLLAAAVYAQAGGAASVVAQKSKTKGFSYSYETEEIFMNECSQGANQRVCRCVFGKIKQQYSETDYWRLENDLRRNVDHPEYISYLTESVEQCDAEYAEGSYGGSGYGLAGLLGGGGGGIATKAKGSIRTPSEHDIEIGAGSSRYAADIMKVVRQRMPGLRHVYNKLLKKKPGFQGKVALKFTIDPSGVIISISIAASTTGYSEFDNEIKSAVSRWKFSKVNAGNTTVTIPFTFSE